MGLTPVRRVAPPWHVYRAKRDPGWEGYPILPVRPSNHLGWLPHLTSKRDQDEMIDYMDRRASSPRRVTSRTRGPPTPLKQAPRVCFRKVPRYLWSCSFIYVRALVKFIVKCFGRHTFTVKSHEAWTLYVRSCTIRPRYSIKQEE